MCSQYMINGKLCDRQKDLLNTNLDENQITRIMGGTYSPSACLCQVNIQKLLQELNLSMAIETSWRVYVGNYTESLEDSEFMKLWKKYHDDMMVITHNAFIQKQETNN